MFDVIAIGESLIDFTPNGMNDMGMQLFACNPGGAPANVLAMNAKLGGRTAFIGKVGNDDFGRFLQRTMFDANIDISSILLTNEVPTTLAFVQLAPDGDRSFSFYRKPGADIMLRADEVSDTLLQDCRIFHFGSVSLTDEPCRTATIQSVIKAKAAGAMISYDPNYRPLLWNDEKSAVQEMIGAMQYADILKVSEEEMTLLTNETDLETGSEKLASYGPSLIFVTLGSNGAFYFTPSGCGIVNTCSVDTVDTTGAGDAFLGALLHYIEGRNLEQLKEISKEEWNQAIAFANAAGTLTTTKKGAIKAMPDKNQIEACMESILLL